MGCGTDQDHFSQRENRDSHQDSLARPSSAHGSARLRAAQHCSTGGSGPQLWAHLLCVSAAAALRTVAALGRLSEDPRVLDLKPRLGSGGHIWTGTYMILSLGLTVPQKTLPL